MKRDLIRSRRGIAERAHRQPADGTCHTVAIKIERGPIGRHHNCFGIEFHAVDHGQKIRFAQSETMRRRKQHARRRIVRHAARQCADLGTPRRQIGALHLDRRRLVGDVIDQAAKRVNAIHGGAAVGRQDAHAAVE